MTSGSRRGAGELGVSLIEVLVAFSLMLVALTMFGVALTVAQRTQIRDSEYSAVNDSVHLAIAAMDRQIRSGYVLNGSTAVGGAADYVRIFTATSTSARCILWVIYPTTSVATPFLEQGLYTKSWVLGASAPPFNPATWRLVARGIVGADGNAFVIETPSGQVLPRLRLHLHLNVSRDERKQQEIEISSTFTSRNSPRALEPIGTTSTTTGGACA